MSRESRRGLSVRDLGVALFALLAFGVIVGILIQGFLNR